MTDYTVKVRAMTVLFSRKSLLATGLTLAVGMGLSACITLLPEEKPAQLYSFSYNAEAVLPDPVGKASKSKAVEAPVEPAPELADMDRFQLYLAGTEFPKQASSDRIMTTEGAEVSFISHVRWAAPASDLFADSLSEGFDRAATRVHLSSQIKGASKYRLELKVRRFEVTYTKKRPTVTVALDANIVRITDRKLVASRYITSDVGVAKSDVTLIVAGFEKATSRVIYGLVKFTEDTALTSETVKTPAS